MFYCWRFRLKNKKSNTNKKKHINRCQHLYIIFTQQQLLLTKTSTTHHHSIIYFFLSFSMLLIGDIHINSRHAETLIHMLRNYATAHDDRQILLLGDVVYHFSYQRGALLQLFELFVERYQQDKQVIVLAGNHDWIQDAYVYAEAQKAFAVIQKKDLTEGASGIFFVTHPQLVDLE